MAQKSVVVDNDAAARTSLIKVKGPFDFNLHRAFQEAFRSSEFRSYVIDLTETTYLDSSGLGSLLHLKEFSESKGGTMEVVAVPGLILKTLEMAHFDTLMTIRKAAA